MLKKTSLECYSYMYNYNTYYLPDNDFFLIETVRNNK